MITKRINIAIVAIVFFIFVGSNTFAANITGTIKFQGVQPKFRALATSADPACPGSVYPEVLVLGSNNELANVLVYISKGVPPGKYYPPDKPVVLNQVGCRFDPHVFAAMVGQQVVFLTSDQTLHTVDFHGKKNRKFAVEMPKWYKGGTKVFNKEEFMVPIMCSVHPWMLAFANILSHPYFFVSEKNGRFLIRELPPGEYTIEAWHEKLGRQQKTITIQTNDQLKVIDFNFAAR